MSNINEKEVLLSVKDLEITFGTKRKKFVAVDHVSFDIYKGETFSLVGESGSGKTTIGRAVVRINPTSNGEILFKGKKINGKITNAEKTDLIKKVQMIFQDPAASLNERATVDYIVSEGLHNFKLYENEEDRVRKITEMISKVGLLPEHLTRYPHEFSGGQRQRIGIARALIVEPELLIADEPISALDVSIQAQVINLLKDLQSTLNLTILFIAHDLSVVKYFSDRIAVMHFGKIVELASSEDLFNNPLHPYTKSLLSAIPFPNPIYEKTRKRFSYDASVHNYSETNQPSLVDVGGNHFVYGSPDEIANYKKEVVEASKAETSSTPVDVVAKAETKEKVVAKKPATKKPAAAKAPAKKADATTKKAPAKKPAAKKVTK